MRTTPSFVLRRQAARLDSTGGLPLSGNVVSLIHWSCSLAQHHAKLVTFVVHTIVPMVAILWRNGVLHGEFLAREIIFVIIHLLPIHYHHMSIISCLSFPDDGYLPFLHKIISIIYPERHW